MGILKTLSKRHMTLHLRKGESLHHKVAITQDNGILLRFDRYGKPGDTTDVPQVYFRSYQDDAPFLTSGLDIDADPRYATVHFLASSIPELFATRKVYFDCIGHSKTTGNLEVLFTGTIDFQNL